MSSPVNGKEAKGPLYVNYDSKSKTFVHADPSQQCYVWDVIQLVVNLVLERPDQYRSWSSTEVFYWFPVARDYQKVLHILTASEKVTDATKKSLVSALAVVRMMQLRLLLPFEVFNQDPKLASLFKRWFLCFRVPLRTNVHVPGTVRDLSFTTFVGLHSDQTMAAVSSMADLMMVVMTRKGEAVNHGWFFPVSNGDDETGEAFKLLNQEFLNNSCSNGNPVYDPATSQLLVPGDFQPESKKDRFGNIEFPTHMFKLIQFDPSHPTATESVKKCQAFFMRGGSFFGGD
mmetsp:Transcript_2751/g.3739  ORF Transcript_2751/g.3739 Transcript_2751/m.3739 type:complete len:287 (-) Transcript_2751:35-895(-)